MYKEIDLSLFPPERKQKLEDIYRYHFFDVLLYRSNLWMHTHRVLWLLEEVAPVAQKYLKFDLEKARALALVHDDVEMITGDMSAVEKTVMSDEVQREHEKAELEAIDKIAATYPSEIHGYSYKELLKSALKKDSVEAQLVSYMDKLDGYCESLHEVYAGNYSLIRSVVFYANIMPTYIAKYPELKDFLSNKDSEFTNITQQISPLDIKASNFSHLGRPHTEETINIDTDFPFYRTWKRIVIERGKLDWLIKQREFLPH